ncbi:MAG: ABC transporter ATP-binding protein [Sneathiella sp.]|nr:ABC transporter ATP-binding protein [Sneathiella sp.]
MVVDDTTSVASQATRHILPQQVAGDTDATLPEPIGVQINLANISYNDQIILENIKLNLEPGKTTCLLGPSGVGKTSILKTIAGFLALSPASSIETSDGDPLQGRISYMDQSDLLLPWASSLDNVLISARLKGERPDFDKANQLLDQVGLQDKKQAIPAELSGGMKQRVALARTLMDDSPLVLVDEPFSALDAITRHRLQGLFAKMLHNRTVLMITHDPMEALRIGHHIFVLSGNPVLLSPDLKMTGAVPRDPASETLRQRYELILSMLGMTRDDR